MGDQFNCTECHSVLDSIGTQAYCPQCLASTPNLQQEVRVVPEHYQSNCANKRELEQ
jgi:Zn finger protein HypA/HybF involved in hydrogenase expression